MTVAWTVSAENTPAMPSASDTASCAPPDTESVPLLTMDRTLPRANPEHPVAPPRKLVAALVAGGVLPPFLTCANRLLGSKQLNRPAIRRAANGCGCDFFRNV